MIGSLRALFRVLCCVVVPPSTTPRRRDAIAKTQSKPRRRRLRTPAAAARQPAPAAEAIDPAVLTCAGNIFAIEQWKALRGEEPYMGKPEQHDAASQVRAAWAALSEVQTQRYIDLAAARGKDQSPQ